MGTPTNGIAAIAALVTPALLILASASLVASALVRMGRVVDRARALSKDDFRQRGVTPELLATWLVRHASRATYVSRSITLLYAAVAIFVASCIAIAADRAVGGSLTWLPVSLALAGTFMLLGGAACLVIESRLGSRQIQEEIQLTLSTMERGAG